MKPILCCDFDGVIHSYTSPWTSAEEIHDFPVPGALEWLNNARGYFSINIFSSRSWSEEARVAMSTWLEIHAYKVSGWTTEFVLREFLPDIKFPSSKPPAFLTIDDRAITFNGDWNALDPKALLKFRPWNKK